MVNLNRVKWDYQFAFETYGVIIGIRANREEPIENLKSALDDLFPMGWTETDYSEREHLFSIYIGRDKKNGTVVYKNEEVIFTQYEGNDYWGALESSMRLTVAEYAKEFIFLHAGAVADKGKAIIIPGKSFSGKTTLTAELARRGFQYYSDEYAVIDKDGMLHPFTKKLSVRGIIDDYQQVDIDVEEMGGSKGEKPVSIGMILVTSYKKNARFRPEVISSGQGMIESIANSVSIRQNPQMVLNVLGVVSNNATVVQVRRTEVKQFVDKFLRYLDESGFYN